MLLPSLSALGLDQNIAFIELAAENMPKAPRRSGASITPVPIRQRTRRRTNAWPPDLEKRLLDLKSDGLKWYEIEQDSMLEAAGKSDNACRKHWELLMRYKKAEEWDKEKLAQLATLYMSTREEMWGTIADKLGEPWDLIETKVLENGLRGLESILRGGVYADRVHKEPEHAKKAVRAPASKHRRRHTLASHELPTSSNAGGQPPRYAPLAGVPEQCGSPDQSYGPVISLPHNYAYSNRHGSELSNERHTHQTRQSFGYGQISAPAARRSEAASKGALGQLPSLSKQPAAPAIRQSDPRGSITYMLSPDMPPGSSSSSPQGPNSPGWT